MRITMLKFYEDRNLGVLSLCEVCVRAWIGMATRLNHTTIER